LQPLSPPVSVKVGEHGVVSNAPLYIAKARGYFEGQGLSVEFLRLQTGPAMTAPMASGDIDVGVGAPGASLFNAIAREIPLKIVADKGQDYHGRSYQVLVARRGLVESGGLASFSDLRGKRIGLTGRGGVAEIDVARAL